MRQVLISVSLNSGERTMKVTFFGTTTLLFDDGKDQILFDCHFTRPSILSYIRGGDPEKRHCL